MDSKHLLWLLMSHHIHRYLIANTDGRLDYHQKAEQHIILCKIFLAGHFMCEIDEAGMLYPDEFEVVHDDTQELTGYMDVKIGFPHQGRPDYGKLKPLFFDKFYELATDSLKKSDTQ